MATSEGSPRMMPQSAEAEIAVLGSILLSPNEALDLCLQQLTPEHFYQRSHQIIFAAIAGMRGKGEPVDAVTVTTRLKDAGKLEEVGGAYYLSRLSVAFPTAAHVDFYVRILREKYRLRRLIETATAAIQRAYEWQDEAEKVIDEVETEILKISDDKTHKEMESIKEITDRVVSKVSEIQENRGKVAGLSWGFRDLDRLTFGLREAEMVVVAARPGIGKTSLALNVAEKLVLDKKIPVGIFSLEMTADQLALRMACSRSRVNMWHLYHGGISEKSLQEFGRAARLIGDSQLYIMDTPQISIAQLRAASRRLKNRFHIEILIVDYLQLMVATGLGRNDSREREVSMISGGLKALAKELKIPVIVLSQLNRQVEQRDDGKPRLSNLRESGAIEQDADIVCLLARKDAYDEEGGAPKEAIEADVIIAKNRNGPVGEIKLTFFPEYTRFEDFTPLEGG
ncbi:MAG: replicative DNA helicase [Verrucomicrobia bacterium]|nr:replicative DNA helicase [Verrucomicrobiota bacterium]